MTWGSTGMSPLFQQCRATRQGALGSCKGQLDFVHSPSKGPSLWAGEAGGELVKCTVPWVVTWCRVAELCSSPCSRLSPTAVPLLQLHTRNRQSRSFSESKRDSGPLATPLVTAVCLTFSQKLCFQSEISVSDAVVAKNTTWNVICCLAVGL